MEDTAQARYIINKNSLPDTYPTHLHSPEFWEWLGRVVATFGFLENVLARAIFSFTATKPYAEEEIKEAFNEWLPKLENALKDPLRGLIDNYGKAVRDHPKARITNLKELLNDLRKASEVRNVICHGFWNAPNKNKASVPFFVNRKKEKFDTPVNIKYLNQLQAHVAELACNVTNTVTQMGWQFPGSSGPGKVIWRND